MHVLNTPRLFLTPLTRALMWRRMSAEGKAGFEAAVDGPDGKVTVQLPGEWPGDFLPMLAVLLAGGADVVDGAYVAVERASLTAVGQLSTKGWPDKHGAIEIGYGLTPQAQGRGLATEAVGALLASLEARPDVNTVTAQTLPSNLASQRVLTKLNFERTAQAWDTEDGDLWVWTWRRRPLHT
ncbi:GNAT family N-acetyltransferase [Deinococcus sp. QL22]|uniref:GNAT family N-acetyltransferase n=1 Tax=Deinococcus sp. QL22 TaxID=2939437 RepID=UPI0020173CDC|nr:GNAT family protein [Deinococcus sp. QL22]UQN05307.1 GNAT family N-acetyltransferase [Deinococcus sp. QL22]